MCGIVGYIGEQPTKDFIIDGLKKLEYRGYDSSGAFLFDSKGYLKKCKKERLLTWKRKWMMII